MIVFMSWGYASTHGDILNLFWFETLCFVFGFTEHLSIILKGVNTITKNCFAAVIVTIQGLTKHRRSTKLKTNATNVIGQYFLGNENFQEGLAMVEMGIPLAPYMRFTKKNILRLLIA